MRLIRGVSKCGIAKTIVTVDCAKVSLSFTFYFRQIFFM